MLLELEVLNGSMTPNFSPDIYEYTVYISDEDSLDLKYKVENDLPVTIYGNEDLTDGESHVLLELFNEKVITYKLTVNKNTEKSVSSENSTYEKVEVNLPNTFLEDIKTPAITVTCFLIIATLFAVIFHK